MLRIEASGILGQSEINSIKACYTFSSFITLNNGDLLAAARRGDNKDSELEGLDFFISNDEGDNWSEPWEPFKDVYVDKIKGSLKLCYFTEISASHLLASFLWIDRTSHPGKELFNAETEGCLPMRVLLSDSFDQGKTWSSLRSVEIPDEIGPPSLTNSIMKLPDGKLLMSIENNKKYHDKSTWKQKAVFLSSINNGKSWSSPFAVADDESGRIFNWDLRCGVDKSGRICSFAWTYDSHKEKFLNIHQRISVDAGQTWTKPKDLKIADQASHPALSKDGKIILPWVDRFQSRSIKVRIANNLYSEFNNSSEITIFEQTNKNSSKDNKLGKLLADMSIWNFGLPYADVLPSGKILVFYYAGNNKQMNLHWTRLTL